MSERSPQQLDLIDLIGNQAVPSADQTAHERRIERLVDTGLFGYDQAREAVTGISSEPGWQGYWAARLALKAANERRHQQGVLDDR